MSVMTGAFAILATLVAAIGLWRMFAFAVAQRTPEIGLQQFHDCRARWVDCRAHARRLAAGLVPADRAACIDPMALKYE